MNLAESRGPWLLGEGGLTVLAVVVLVTAAVTLAAAAARGRGRSAGARTGLGLGAAAALAGAAALTVTRADGQFLAMLGVVLPFGLAAGAVGWAVRLARHGG
ncbi:hypothetical protein ACIQ9P_25435 [Kitasatospora sp. NPDC094019]|uniref:hypothetical protein n=1 Tax=Kitasatospora sp. NPDC094019 TaxID=3364091 RepID=UPI00381479DC